MSFGIIRVRNLTRSDIAQTQKHNSRDFDSGERPEHIGIGKYPNSHSYISGYHEDMNTAISMRISQTGAAERKNSVVAIEYVCTLSPDAMMQLEKSNYSISSVLDFCKDFVETKHGKENVISIAQHADESNPHIHIIVTPIIEKQITWKNANGAGLRVENRLCARDYTGSKELLSTLQDEYFKHISGDEYFNSVFDRCKIELKRGVKRSQKKKFYSKMTNHVLGQFRKEVNETKMAIADGSLTKEQGAIELNRLESKISHISDSIERKMEKDAITYKDSLKTHENSFKFDL